MADLPPNVLGPIPDDGASDEFANEISYFKDFLSNPDTTIPINSNFVIRFDAIPAAVKDNTIQDFEPRWNIQNTNAALADIVEGNGTGVCLFANGVIPPVEAVQVDRAGVHNEWGDYSGGLLSGVVSKSRMQQPPLDIAFLETNKSFVDFVIRPWIVLVSHFGLIARPDPYSIKTSVNAVFFDATDPSAPIRKYYRFNDCAPVSIAAGTSFDYGTTSVNVFKTSWAYSTYDIMDVSPNN